MGEPLVAPCDPNRKEATDDLIRMLTASADIPGNVKLPREAVNMLLTELRVRDEALGRVADAVVIHVAHDTEAHARSFNEGYETAIAQGLADDPTLAQDWLDAKLADAKAEALEQAARDLPYLDRPSNMLVRQQDAAAWLRSRATELRAP